MADGLLTLTAYFWDGDPPRAGHYLRTLSGRTAYLIVEVVRPKRPGTRYFARFRCERAAPAAIPEGAPSHTWEWGKREKARRTLCATERMAEVNAGRDEGVSARGGGDG